METLLQWDRQLFLLIHLGAQNAVLDFIAPLLRNKIFWTPLYAFILFYLWYNVRQWFWPIVFSIVSLAAATDLLSSRVIKPSVGRVRPCNELVLRDQIRQIVPCGAGKSFTSSHAANHFGLAAFLVMGLGFLQGRRRWVWYLWAASIALSQVYVGVHYPGDILGGAALGLLLGWMWSKGFTGYRNKYTTQDA
jgi:membrane-associated phospholipid phosphatase